MDLRLVRLNKLPGTTEADPQDLLLLDVKQPDGSFVSEHISIFNTFQTAGIRLTDAQTFDADGVIRNFDLSLLQTQSDFNHAVYDAILDLQNSSDGSSGVILSDDKPEVNNVPPLPQGTLWIKPTTMTMYTLVREEVGGDEFDYWVGVTERKV